MGRISSPSIGLDNENLIPYIEHRLGTESRIGIKFNTVDITGYTFLAHIEEIDTPAGTPPEAGYVTVTGGEKWVISDEAFLKKIPELPDAQEGVPPIGSSTSVTLPAELGTNRIRSSGGYVKSGTSTTTPPKPGLVKYYQMGIRFDSGAGTSDEVVLQVRLLYSVVSQNGIGE